MRIRLAAAAVASVGLLAAAACGNGGDEGNTQAPPQDALSKAHGVTTVTFWHEMNGSNATALNTLINRFNTAHKGRIVVKPVYEGTYDDAITKYKAAVVAHDTPSMIQIYDVGSQFMIDSGQVVPMQDFIDRDHYSTKDLQPNITGYYSIGGKLYSMPFNTSMPVLYYNKDQFRKAGLDPDKPPTTLAEIRKDSEQIVKSKAAAYGFNAAIYGWYIEQYVATAGKEFCNNGNGRDARASKVNYSQPTTLSLFNWWKKMLDDKLAVDTGRDTASAQAAFEAERAAITVESTGTLGVFIKAAQAKGFDLGVGYYPKPAGSTGGPIIGGASLWISGKEHSAAEKEASWELTKFLSSPASQAYWHTQTGYFPINKKALNQPLDVQYRKKYPQFDVAVRQLQSTKLTPATQGCLLGVMPQARQATEEALELTLNGSSSPTSALGAENRKIQSAITGYNDSTRKR